jgi:hypothetical protein
VATFRFVGRDINIHWNGYDIKGPAGTVFSIPDQLYEEFEDDLRGAEPSLEWIDTNEFLTLTNAVSVTTLDSSFPISVTSTTSGKIIGVTSSTASDGFVLTANGSGGVAWESLPADATGITSIIGTSPISAAVSGTQATITIDQAAITGSTAAINAQVVRFLVKNTTGTTIPKGSAVYVSGATGDNALISLASATSETTSSKTLGITSESIATDAFGYVVEAGYLTDIDTSATTAGAAVWLGNTPGSLVFVTPPAEPSHAVYLGVVVRVQSNNGSILVKVQNGYELDELHDVSAASPSDGDIIQYKNSSSLWTKSSVAAAGIAASVHTHAYQDAGTYVTAVNGTAPITASTDTAGIVSVSLSASYSTSTHDHSGVYQVAGNYSTDTHTHTLPPTGSIVMWPTSSAPSGYLFLDGSTHSQATYPELAAVFGVLSGTFTLPDMRDRFAAGLSIVGALSNNAGTFAPDTSNSIAHTHSTNIAHGHSDTIEVNTHALHDHSVNVATTTSSGPSASTNRNFGTQTLISVPSGDHTHTVNPAAVTSADNSAGISHTVTGGVTSLGTTNVTSGAMSANDTVLPKSTLLNFIIKT